MKFKISKKWKEALTSYLRHAIVVVGTLLVTGNTDPKALGLAFLGAVAGPILRAIDPNDTTFGVGSDTPAE